MVRGVGGASPSNVQSYLAGVDYPASKDDLLSAAKKNGAPREIMQVIEGFERPEFGGPQEVMKEYGRERRAQESHG